MSDLQIGTTSSVTATVTGMSSVMVMVTMDVDGNNVKIKWEEVERQAAGPSGSYLTALAKALLAARESSCRTEDDR